MLKNIWFILNKPRKFWSVINIIGYTIIGLMVFHINSRIYEIGKDVGTIQIYTEAIKHHAGMFDLLGDGKFRWRDELEEKYNNKPLPFYTPKSQNQHIYY